MKKLILSRVAQHNQTKKTVREWWKDKRFGVKAELKITIDAARRFTLRKQCFQPSRAGVEKEQIFRVLRELGCVQIDTVNVVERSHYLAFWSRLGSYRKEFLDQLLYPDRKVFEYWAHAASIIPMEYYRYFVHSMNERRKEMRSNAKRWLTKDAKLLDTVLHEIKRNGPLCSKDFEFKKKGKKNHVSGWWNWKPAKIALELLYGAGILMVSRREKFQKYYDVTENVLPSSIDTSEPTENERQRFFLEKTISAWGIAEPKDIGWYFYPWAVKNNVGRHSVKGLSGLIKDLEKEDVITTVQVDSYDTPCLILSRDLEALEKTMNTEEQMDVVSFLSPFDNLTWSRLRTRKLFGFDVALEIYVPKQTRKFGYYALNMLYNNQIIGRIDPKMHRDKAMLELKALELEKDFKLTRDFKHQLTLALMDFMKFHNAQTIGVAKTAQDYFDSTIRRGLLPET